MGSQTFCQAVIALLDRAWLSLVIWTLETMFLVFLAVSIESVKRVLGE